MNIKSQIEKNEQRKGESDSLRSVHLLADSHASIQSLYTSIASERSVRRMEIK